MDVFNRIICKQIAFSQAEYRVAADYWYLSIWSVLQLKYVQNLYLCSISSTKVLTTSGHSCGSSSSSSAKPAAAQDIHDDTVELSRGGCQCREETGSGTEQGSDNDNNSHDSSSEEESDTDDSDQEYVRYSV